MSAARGGGGASLGALLALIEKVGSAVMLTRSVDAIVPPDARAALHAAGVLAGAPAVPTWPCDVRGCSREVRSNYDGARKPLVAVCSRAPSECAPVELGFDEVAQQALRVDALVSAVCGLLEAEVERAGIAKVRERVAIGGARVPVLVGARVSPACDVFWSATPRDTDLAAFCARRERVARRTLVLVPTAKHVPLDVAARFARGERVEVMALGDALVVREGRLAWGEGVGVVIEAESEPAPETPRANSPRGSARPRAKTKTRGAVKASGPGLAEILGVKRWEQIRMTVVDGHTLRIDANGQAVLRTFVELGFVDARKTEIVTPVAAWGVVIILCRTGKFRPSEYKAMGKAWGAKKAVQVVRGALRAGFGLEGDPLRMYSKKAGWEARFLRGE